MQVWYVAYIKSMHNAYFYEIPIHIFLMDICLVFIHGILVSSLFTFTLSHQSHSRRYILYRTPSQTPTDDVRLNEVLKRLLHEKGQVCKTTPRLSCRVSRFCTYACFKIVYDFVGRILTVFLCVRMHKR